MKCKIKFAVVDEDNKPLTEDMQTYVNFNPSAAPHEIKDHFAAAGMSIGQFALKTMVPDYPGSADIH